MKTHLKTYGPFFIAGMLGASVIWGASLVFNPPTSQVVSLNIRALTHRFSQAIARRELSQAKKDERVTQFVHTLDSTLIALAQTHHWVIVPSQAVLQGGEDITALVQQTMEAAK